MPLPPALLARLQKRGIVVEGEDKPSSDETVEHEEVIAEDYDDVNKPPESKGKLLVVGCPNKYNIYHDCSYFCQKKWGNGKQEPSPKTKRKYKKLIKRFPLPDGWQDVYDPGVGVYYFWNTQTDEVSWLPPNHPKAHISLSAEKMKALVRNDRDEDEDEQMESEDDDSQSDTGSDISDDQSDDESDEVEMKKKERFGGIERRETSVRTQHGQRQGRRPVLKQNDLDPMDPASYSDIPRGRWSDGLNQKGDAKTGVDSTASGSLFQSRPYPSPGAILQMNSAKSKNMNDQEIDDNERF